MQAKGSDADGSLPHPSSPRSPKPELANAGALASPLKRLRMPSSKYDPVDYITVTCAIFPPSHAYDLFTCPKCTVDLYVVSSVPFQGALIYAAKHDTATDVASAQLTIGTMAHNKNGSGCKDVQPSKTIANAMPSQAPQSGKRLAWNM